MPQNESFYLLFLNRLSFLKTKEKLLFLDICSSVEEFCALSHSDLQVAVGRTLKGEKRDYTGLLRQTEKDCLFLEANPAVGCLPFWDPGYPAGLRELYEPPFLLFYRGVLPDWKAPQVAVVGTRKPTGAARSAAFKLALELSERGIGVVSGLARGVDAEAHRGSLSGRGGMIAVLGNGIDSLYPLSNRELGYRLLKKGGLILAEYPPGVPPLRYNFPRRNRIISGLVRGVVVIQAPLRSGALITAEYALEQGRDIYVHRVGMEGNQGAGTKKLASLGAVVIENSSQLFYDWGWMDRKIPPEQITEPGGRQEEHPGSRLAARLQLELNEQCIWHNGDFIRRL